MLVLYYYTNEYGKHCELYLGPWGDFNWHAPASWMVPGTYDEEGNEYPWLWEIPIRDHDREDMA